MHVKVTKNKVSAPQIADRDLTVEQLDMAWYGSLIPTSDLRPTIERH